MKLFWLLTLVLLPAVFASQVAEEDARTIMRGFCDGLDVDADIVPDAYVEGDDVADVITLLSAENQRFALKGLKKLGSVLQRVPDVIVNNGGNEGADTLYLTNLQKLATDLENIDAYEPGDNNNLTVMGVSIVDLVNTATNQLNSGNYLDAGMSIGMALHHIYTATQPAVNEEVIAEVQAKAEEQGWTPGEVPAEFTEFPNIEAFAKAKLGANEEEHTKEVAEMRRRRRAGIVPKPIYARQSYPASFDARTKWPNCVHGGRSQGGCGSCWAFAGTGVLNDRFCIASNGKINKYFSPQQMLECDKKSSCEKGGWESYVYQHARDQGIFQESCFPYSSGFTERYLGQCPSKCKDGSAPNKFYVSEVINVQNENDVKYQLMNFGPLSSGMTVYEDFQMYTGGIYSHVSGTKAGGHAIKLVGWGTDEKTKRQYWICANSWGTKWGENGHFRIRFGDSDILRGTAGATPDLTKSINTNSNGADIPKEDDSGNAKGGQEFGGDEPTQPSQPTDDGGDWGNWDDWGSDWGSNDDNSGGSDDWGNWDDWGSDWGNNNDDWGNWDDWGSDSGNNNDDWGNWDDWGSGSNDDWGNWDDWGSGGNDDWGNWDDWGSGSNNDWGNWGWRRQSKTGVVSRGIRNSIRKDTPKAVRKNPMTPNRPPFRRRRPTNRLRRRRSISKNAIRRRRASIMRAKAVTVRNAEGTKSIQKQVHHLRKH